MSMIPTKNIDQSSYTRRASPYERGLVCQYLREEGGKGGPGTAQAIEEGRVTVFMDADDNPILKLNEDPEKAAELALRSTEDENPQAS